MKITPTKIKDTVTFKTSEKPKKLNGNLQWWKAKSEKDMCKQVISAATYLKQNQGYRVKQTATYAKLYGNQSLYNFAGSNMSRMDQTNSFPIDRPTFNLIQSAADTLISRIGQNKPQPVFLTKKGDYKERKLAKQLNDFIQGELYATKAYEKTVQMLRDALVTGTGVLKVYENQDHRVSLERRLLTELYVDTNEAIYGEPRQLYELKLVDRDVLKEWMPDEKSTISGAEEAFPDAGTKNNTLADQVLIVEAWHLPSSKDADDGYHVIACSSGILLKEKYTKSSFPFIFLHYSPRLLGFWSQGLAEQLMGTQIEINTLLFTMSKSIKVVGVPRVYIEDGSKVINAQMNNDIGVIVRYRGTMPHIEAAAPFNPMLMDSLERLIVRGYQQCGVSALDAGSQKPAGLNSGEAIRNYDDISVARFQTLSKRYDDVFIDVAQQIFEKAKDICEEQGSYSTVYPTKNGTKEVDLPAMDKLKSPFVVQVFNQSSLPKDPAGRMEKVVEMVQSGMIDLREGRRLLDYPDLDQMEQLANASEERIFQTLDNICEEGKYVSPDPFMDLALAEKLTVQYYNLYVAANLEEDRAQMLRTFFDQIQGMKQQAAAPQMPQAGAIPPQATPEPLPASPLVPNAVQPGVAA